MGKLTKGKKETFMLEPKVRTRSDAKVGEEYVLKWERIVWRETV